MGRPVAFDGPRGLILLLQGVLREDVTCPDTTPELAALCTGQVPISLQNPSTERSGGGTGSAVDVFGNALPTDRLRGDYGLELDRRSWALRSDWQSDRSVLDQMAVRPRGRADAVTLWLRDAGRTATAHGIGSAAHRQALRDLDADVRRARQICRHRDLSPDVTLAFVEPLSPAERSFDAASAVRRCMPKGSRRGNRLRIAQSPSALIVRASSYRDLSRVFDLLRSEGFANHGAALDLNQRRSAGLSERPDEAWFLPYDRVALGPAGTAASHRLLEKPGARQVAIVPWATTARSMTITELATQWAAGLIEQLRPRSQTAAPAGDALQEAFPDLLGMLGAETREALRAMQKR